MRSVVGFVVVLVVGALFFLMLDVMLFNAQGLSLIFHGG